MKKYWHLIKLSWQTSLQYRKDFILRILGGLFMMVVTIVLWIAIYEQSGVTEIRGYTLEQMIVYLLGAGLFYSFIFENSQGDEVNDEINQGILSTYLIKPFSVNLFWFIRDLANKIMMLFQGGIILLILIFIITRSYNLTFNFSQLNLLLFFISIFVAIGIHYFLFHIFSVIAFWLEQTWGPRFVLRAFMNIATGRLIPLSLFPIVWFKILNVLPFKFMAFLPMEILLNKIPITETLIQLGIGLIWISIFMLICILLYKVGVKRYSGEGI